MAIYIEESSGPSEVRGLTQCGGGRSPINRGLSRHVEKCEGMAMSCSIGKQFRGTPAKKGRGRLMKEGQ